MENNNNISVNPDRTSVALVSQAIDRLEIQVLKYTNVSDFTTIATRIDQGDTNDTKLLEVRNFVNMLENFIIHFKGDWPKNNSILVKRLKALRERWLQFVEKNDVNEIKYYHEYNILNVVLSKLEDGLCISDEYNQNNQHLVAWHYALAMVLKHKAGTLDILIGRKKFAIQQAIKTFNLPENIGKNTYDSLKKMRKSKNPKDGWDLDYYFKTFARRRMYGYKDLIKNLLLNDEEALKILEGLPDDPNEGLED